MIFFEGFAIMDDIIGFFVAVRIIDFANIYFLIFLNNSINFNYSNIVIFNIAFLIS